MNSAKVIVKVKHDTGVENISIFATSIESAKEMVMKAKGCPLNAILSAKVAHVNIYDIKRKTAETAPYFFTRKTLNFFKQRMNDFKVYRQGDDKFLIKAKVLHGGYTQRIFNPFTNELEHLPTIKG